MTAIVLRPASAADVPRLTRLVRAAYGHYVERIGGPPRPMTDDYAEVVRSQQVTVAEREGEIAGLVVLDIGDEGFVIDNVAVDPGQQGSGVGRALLEHAEGAARTAGFDSIQLFTHERMTENLALYSRASSRQRRTSGSAARPCSVDGRCRRERRTLTPRAARAAFTAGMSPPTRGRRDRRALTRSPREPPRRPSPPLDASRGRKRRAATRPSPSARPRSPRLPPRSRCAAGIVSAPLRGGRRDRSARRR